MNSLEKKLLSLLLDLKENHGASGVRVDFEAEGTRLEEALRLKDIAGKADVNFSVKIGGCEAIKDIHEAKCLGVSHLVAPMVETDYALKKYLKAIDKVFADDLENRPLGLINLETLTACRNFDQMLAQSATSNLRGIVLGRVDLAGSMGKNRGFVNSKEILELSLSAAAKAAAKNLTVTVGGAITMESNSFFEAFPRGHLNHYETRKIVFDYASGTSLKPALLKAIEFEILWLKNKKKHYQTISKEDDERLSMLEKRL